MPRFLVLVVNYNQRDEIAPFLVELSKEWPKEDVLLIDDGSSDSSPQIAHEMGFEVILHSSNRGVGAALRTGYQAGRDRGYSHVVIMSSNGKMRPDQIARIIEPVREGTADYVTGSRFLQLGIAEKMPLGRIVAIKILSAVGVLLFRRHFSDITCGYRCYPLDFVFNQKLDVYQEWLNRYEMEYYLHFYACRLGLRIAERPVTIRYGHLSKARRSKIQPITGWLSILRPFFLLGFRLRR